jgi:hypothetical protein
MTDAVTSSPVTRCTSARRALSTSALNSSALIDLPEAGKRSLSLNPIQRLNSAWVLAGSWAHTS